MAAKKVSPNRRKSIAVINQSRSAPLPRSKRRPHSIVAGDRLSPLIKARRSLVPRKSILKGSLNIPSLEDTQTESQQPQVDEANMTSSQDLTNDFRLDGNDNTSRKSLGRRVSFAAHAHVRLFGIRKDSINGNTSPQSLPASEPSDHERDATSRASEPQTVNDENVYPGASALNRWRSSVRRSIALTDDGGEESMELDLNNTAHGPSAFLQASRASGSAVQDGSYDDDEEYSGDDMEITEALQANISRKQKRSVPGGQAIRAPLSTIASTAARHDSSDDQDADQSQSFQDDLTNASSIGTSDSTGEPMEYTIPLNQSLRPPAPPDEAWFALRRMTHSGDTPDEPSITSEEDTGDNEMDLNDAMQRLIRAKSPLPLPDNTGDRDDSFSSTDASFVDNDTDNGDKTMNMSKIYGRVSMGGQSAFDTTMETTNVHGGLVSVFVNEQGPAPPFAPVQTDVQHLADTSRPSVFHPPAVFTAGPPSNSTIGPTPPSVKSPSNASSANRQPRPTAPVAFSFTPKPSAIPVSKTPAPTSPSKVTLQSKINHPSASKPKFSAAFAPPVARSSPKKRMRSHDEDGDIRGVDKDKPSPSKKTALAGRWTPTATTAVAASSLSNTDSTKPKPLSPSKKAPFQGSSPPQTVAPISLRRPSGYFARRTSMAVGLSTNLVTEADGNENGRVSPKKKAVIDLRRASVGGVALGVTQDWNKLGKDTIAQNKGKEKNVDTVCEREVVRQANAAPSPTRGSPSPGSSLPNSPTRAHFDVTATPEKAQVELSRLLANREEFGLEQGAEMEDESIAMDADPVTADSTERWREAVLGHDFVEDEGPPISIEQFFSMTGIKFMDEITAPRRSTHPSQLRLQPRSRRNSRELPDIPFTEYVIAMAVDIPQLELYTRVSKELQAWIEQIKDVFKQAEEEAAKVTPELFREYLQASEDARLELLHQLKLIRTNVRETTKSEWYDWKLLWVERLYAIANKSFADLETDAKAIEELNNRTQNLLPALNEEYAQVMHELEQDQADVAEIESCDKEYLNELKGSIAEQNIELEALHADVAESKDQLGRLQERLEVMESQGRETISAITGAKRLAHVQKNSTTAEVFKLKDELATLENLHMFRVTKVRSDLFELVYASQFRVSIPCVRFKPVVDQVDVCRIEAKSRSKDAYPNLTAFWLRVAKNHIARGIKLTTTGEIVRRLADYWSSCTRLRAQLQLLNVKYPLSIEVIQATKDRPSGFRARAVVLFHSLKAKAFVSFVFDEGTFSAWPMSIDSVRCEIEVAYGPLDPNLIFNAVVGRMREATPANNHACLLDACIEALDVCA